MFKNLLAKKKSEDPILIEETKEPAKVMVSPSYLNQEEEKLADNRDTIDFDI